MTTRQIMLLVLAALVPGAVAQAYFFGPAGVAGNVAVALAAGLGTEAVCLWLLRRGIATPLGDGSTALTCVLLALALPPGTPAGVVLLAAASAVAIGKYLYGGLGGNLFNPALVGYALVLVSFPALLAEWPVPVDGLTGATPLVTFRFRDGATVADVWQPSLGFGALGGYGWEWINAAFLAGGLALVALRLVAWRVPAAMLLTLGLLALVWYDGGSSASLGSPVFHWLTGGTMLAAFFFATDPVTHPSTHLGQWLFGALVGTLVFVIRSFGNYPDGIAFAILLGNAVTPYLDKRLVPARAR